MESFSNSYAVIDLDAIAANFRNIREKAGVPVMGIIKANAYGHGVVPIARVLQKQCAFFGVATMSEALELRQAGITLPILLLGPVPTAAFPTAIQEGIRPTIFRYEDALALSEAAQAASVDAPFHIAVDTGMSRIGFQVTEEDADLCAKMCALPGIVPEGLFSHFATAESADLTRTRAQADKFAAFDQMLKERGVQVKLRHLNNSAGIMNFPTPYEMVRSGIIIYGLYPSHEIDPALLPLKPAMSWYSRVTHVKTLEPGREVSYGGTFVTDRPTVVATVPIGYADGYQRSLSNRFYVLIRGQKAPIVGRICMDQLMVNVTDIPDVQVDDRVTLIGTDGENTITMEEISERAGSFHYEFPCCIGSRVPRLYLHSGKIVQSADSLPDNL